MADQKISQLTSYSSPISTDVIPIVDSSNGVTKKIIPASLAFAPATKIVATSSSGFAADYYATGTADDAKIQSAIAAVNAAGGGIVFVRAGTYNISATISMYSNVILQGEGMGSTILQKISGNNNRILYNIDPTNGNSKFIVRDITIDGNYRAASNTGNAIVFTACSNFLIERVYAKDSVGGIQMNTCTDYEIFNCISDSNYDWNFYNYGATRGKLYYNQSLSAKQLDLEGFGMAFYQTSSQCEAVGNYIYNSANNGLQCNAGSSTADVTDMVFRDNIIVSAGLKGIFLTDDGNSFHVKRATVANNRVISAANNGIYSIDIYDSVITGNKVVSSGQSGILVQASFDVMINGNNCFSNSRSGIWLLGTTHSSFMNNSVRNNTTDGIEINDDATTGASLDNTFVGNIVHANTAGGIVEKGTSNYNIFSANDCRGNTTGNFTMLGANSINANNLTV